MGNALINLKPVSDARRKLKPEQIIFAEWLALPSFERVPQTQKALGEQLGVSDETVKNWKKIPEVWMVRDECMDTLGKELVAEAMGTLKQMMKKGGPQAYQAAKDILDRYAEPIRHMHIIASLKDLWEMYHQ